MLALEYITKREHKGLEKLVFFSTLPSTEIWNDEHLKMIEDYQAEEKAAILAEKDGKIYDKIAYKNAIKKFYKEHVGRKSTEHYAFKRKVFPKTNKEIYESMWAKSELFGTGSLKDWTVEEELYKVDMSTLIVSGALVDSTPAMNKIMNKGINNSEWTLLKKSHHIGYIEENDLVLNYPHLNIGVLKMGDSYSRILMDSVSIG